MRGFVHVNTLGRLYRRHKSGMIKNADDTHDMTQIRDPGNVLCKTAVVQNVRRSGGACLWEYICDILSAVNRSRRSL